MSFGPFLRAERLDAGMSLDELARRSGLAKSTVSSIELDDNDPRLSTVKQLAMAFGRDTSVLVRAWEMSE